MPFNVLGLFGMVTVCAILCVLVRKTNPEHAFTITLGCLCVVGTFLLSQIASAIGEIAGIAQEAQLQHLDSLFKAVGISIVGQITADVCKDYGQGALAGIITLAGRFAILLLSLPLFRELLSVAISLMR